MNNKTKTITIPLTCILFLAILIAPSVYADESIVDVVTINVPVSCSMSATGTDSHTANVNNGQTTGNIGTTNLKVICNDNSGYAIYAIGYTDDIYGKTVLTSSTLGSTHDITTATTVTTGTSSWAMKLASVSGTYAPIIAGSTGDSLKVTGDPDFSDYTAVPSTYTKVAYYTSSTDTGTTATGSNLTTTYRAYISPTQPAGTYVGQVKYTLVHPHDTPQTPTVQVDGQLTLIYNAGVGYFDDDPSVKTNTVVYDVTCEERNLNLRSISKTSNLDDAGNKITSLTADDHSIPWGSISVPGASKLKILLRYDFVFNEGNTLIEEDGYSYYENGNLEICDNYNCTPYYGTGTDTLTIEGDEVGIHFYTDATINSAHDYGYYAIIQPLDENNNEYFGKEYSDCEWNKVSGTYKEPKSDTPGLMLEGWRLNNGDLMYHEQGVISNVVQIIPVGEVTIDSQWWI